MDSLDIFVYKSTRKNYLEASGKLQFAKVGGEKVYFRSQILEHPSIGEYWNIFCVPVLPENVIFAFFRTCWCYSEAYNTGTQKWSSIAPGVNILPKEQIFSPMLPSCDHKVSPFLPQFCDYMRGSVATKPLTAWGPGARLRAPGGVQGQSPWWGSRGQRPRKLQGFSQFNILRNSLQRALSYTELLLHYWVIPIKISLKNHYVRRVITHRQ